MTILYIHGLNSPLSEKKRLFLEHYGKVLAPSIDYEKDPKSILNIIELYNKKHTINVVIGSSMGGFVGYYISNFFQCPALLFNPALSKRPVNQQIPDIKLKTSSLKQIVIGTQDNVVNPKDTLHFISNIIDYQPNLIIHIRKNLAHRIPIPVFKDEVTSFFQQL